MQSDDDMQAKILKINPNFPEEGLIKEAAYVLQEGGLVAFPTETVYGIAANFLNKETMDRLYSIKKRPRHKPFTFHIAEFRALEDLDIVLSEGAERLIHKFWPGPLTIIALNKEQEKVGIRMPRNKVALDLIKEVSLPIVAPSANISGKKPPVSGDEVILEMKDVIDVILDAGATEIGRESSIIDVSTYPSIVLREGAIPKDDLLANYHVLFVCTGNSCRSVMAKFMLDRFLKESGLDKEILVDSAGTGSYLGMPAAANTVQVMKETGLDVSMHKGKCINPDLLKKSDFIFVMEKLHKDIVLRMLPEVGSRVRLLKENEDIPDPIGKSLEEYRRVLHMIRDEVENIFLELFKETR